MQPGAENGHASSNELWAITAYWNPMRYERRRANYRHFRDSLELPLVAVELGYESAFELAPSDADILIQIPGRDVIWQKERLLNLALRALPDSCRKVAWIDCDVIFQSDDWHERTKSLLDRYQLVQPFSEVYRLPPDWNPGLTRSSDAEIRYSAPFLIASGMPVEKCLGTPAEQVRCALGYVWAARRELLREHEFYDACIIGGGDSVIVRAAYDRIDDAIRLHLMKAARRDHYLHWALPFSDAVRGSVSYVEGELWHLWHGKSENRQYRRRLEDFSRFDFDPDKDISLDGNQAWTWSSEKPELHGFVQGYFASRMEDG